MLPLGTGIHKISDTKAYIKQKTLNILIPFQVLELFLSSKLALLYAEVFAVN